MSDKHPFKVKVQHHYCRPFAFSPRASLYAADIIKLCGYDDVIFHQALGYAFPDRHGFNMAVFCLKELCDQRPVRWNRKLIKNCHWRIAVVMGPGWFKSDEFRAIYVATMLLR